MIHFQRWEFERSAKAVKFKIDNTAPPEVVANLELLCEWVLDPLREFLGKPIRVTSGYRHPELNRRIGGSKTSDHMYGRAADIVVRGIQPDEIVYAVMDMKLPVKQAISEYNRWTHLSFEQGCKRREHLRATKVRGETVYHFLV